MFIPFILVQITDLLTRVMTSVGLLSNPHTHSISLMFHMLHYSLSEVDGSGRERLVENWEDSRGGDRKQRYNCESEGRCRHTPADTKHF